MSDKKTIQWKNSVLLDESISKEIQSVIINSITSMNVQDVTFEEFVHTCIENVNLVYHIDEEFIGSIKDYPGELRRIELNFEDLQNIKLIGNELAREHVKTQAKHFIALGVISLIEAFLANR